MRLFGPPNIAKLRALRDIPGLIKALSHDRYAVARDAVDALGELGDLSAVDPLVSLLADPARSSLRSSAIAALARLDDPRALAAVIEALTDDDLAGVARRQLVRRGGDVVEPVMRLLEHENVYVRQRVAMLLGDLGEARAVDSLIRRLVDGDEDDSVRSKAADALGQLRDPRALQALASALDDPDEFGWVPRAAAGALRQFVPLPERTREALAAYARREAEPLVRSLIQEFRDEEKRIGAWLDDHRDTYAPGDIGPLGKEYGAIRTDARRRRMALIDRLRDAPDSGVVEEILREILKEGSKYERWAAVRAVDDLAPAGGVQLLIVALEDQDDFVRAVARHALKRVGGPEAEAALGKAADGSGSD